MMSIFTHDVASRLDVFEFAVRMRFTNTLSIVLSGQFLSERVVEFALRNCEFELVKHISVHNLNNAVLFDLSRNRHYELLQLHGKNRDFEILKLKRVSFNPNDWLKMVHDNIIDFGNLHRLLSTVDSDFLILNTLVSSRRSAEPIQQYLIDDVAKVVSDYL